MTETEMVIEALRFRARALKREADGRRHTGPDFRVTREILRKEARRHMELADRIEGTCAPSRT